MCSASQNKLLGPHYLFFCKDRRKGSRHLSLDVTAFHHIHCKWYSLYCTVHIASTAASPIIQPCTLALYGSLAECIACEILSLDTNIDVDFLLKAHLNPMIYADRKYSILQQIHLRANCIFVSALNMHIYLNAR